MRSSAQARLPPWEDGQSGKSKPEKPLLPFLRLKLADRRQCAGMASLKDTVTRVKTSVDRVVGAPNCVAELSVLGAEI